ncbi:MAG: tRNA 2-thiouridine(34) synthase MnmA [Chlamydiales bacterium]|nr:tRNA 2-thiouridine(34) synthase MnmA [Chlamydiales bacterium]
MKKVVVGMSGGVDSSVVAYLLKKQGYDVIGLFMKNWEDEGCTSASDYEDVAAVAGQLEIPFYTVNFAKEYWDRVFSRCLEEYEAGYTPNPDIWCNQEIKFKLFFEKALALGADYLATGHYCRTDGKRLLRGVDENKDQSYFLYTLKNSALDRVLFPLGGMEKSEVRKIAEEAGLATAAKRDSTGICFIGKRNFKEFLARYLPKKAGVFETRCGKVVGEHEGAHYYTIGQRRGLAIGGAGEAWYVVDKEMERNVVIVEQGDHNPELFSSSLSATDVSWVGGMPTFPFKCTAKIRYRSPDERCEIVCEENGKLIVHFESKQKAITPRQSVVFYDGEICLGGAIIEKTLS